MWRVSGPSSWILSEPRAGVIRLGVGQAQGGSAFTDLGIATGRFAPLDDLTWPLAPYVTLDPGAPAHSVLARERGRTLTYRDPKTGDERVLLQASVGSPRWR